MSQFLKAPTKQPGLFFRHCLCSLNSPTLVRWAGESQSPLLYSSSESRARSAFQWFVPGLTVILSCFVALTENTRLFTHYYSVSSLHCQALLQNRKEEEMGKDEADVCAKQIAADPCPPRIQDGDPSTHSFLPTLSSLCSHLCPLIPQGTESCR